MRTAMCDLDWSGDLSADDSTARMPLRYYLYPAKPNEGG
jgi:hypothetical protein